MRVFKYGVILGPGTRWNSILSVGGACDHRSGVDTHLKGHLFSLSNLEVSSRDGHGFSGFYNHRSYGEKKSLLFWLIFVEVFREIFHIRGWFGLASG